MKSHICSIDEVVGMMRTTDAKALSAFRLKLEANDPSAWFLVAAWKKAGR